MKEPQLFAVVDTETGGLNSNLHSLLDLAVVKLAIQPDGLIEVGPSISFKLKPKNDSYIVSPGALVVNNIDIRALGAEAVDYSTAVNKLKSFWNEYFEGKQVAMIGHNPAFDAGFLKAYLGEHYTEFFSHRAVDTSTLGRFLYHTGLFDTDLGSSDLLFKAFPFELPDETRHTALGDALRTAHAYKHMVEKFKMRSHNELP